MSNMIKCQDLQRSPVAMPRSQQPVSNAAAECQEISMLTSQKLAADVT